MAGFEQLAQSDKAILTDPSSAIGSGEVKRAVQRRRNAGACSLERVVRILGIKSVLRATCVCSHQPSDQI